ncbi:4Fe-4S binding protein [Kineosporia sp. A_224]|uniref:4Fe-4S binding protein n=1 Tax=Kineosporia sp. A_224 TaxID=1962180 RepID=UPI000B4B7E86|nr:4Fe-4S binding protein [Kineosporia sp. A_224]
MTGSSARTAGSGAAAGVRIRVPRRPAGWGTRVRLARHGTQAVVVGLVVWQVVQHARSGAASAEAFCPFGGFETAWTWVTTGRTVAHVHTANLVLAAAVVVLALVGRGFFCGWLCPLGTLQGLVHAAGRAVGDRVAPLRRLRRRLGQGAPAARWGRVDRVLRWGRWLVLGWAVGGAALTGTMVFREVDPWVAVLSVVEFEISTAFVVLLVTLVASVVVERPFCRYACPLGAAQSLLGRLSPIAVQRDASACLGCDLCNRACPMGIPVNTRTRVTDTTCLGCLECVAACPSEKGLALTVALPFPGRRS